MKSIIYVVLLITILCICVPQKNNRLNNDLSSIVSLVINQNNQVLLFSNVIDPLQEIPNPEEFPLFDDISKLDYCQYNITSVIMDSYFFSFCPSNDSVFDPDILDEQSNNITIHIQSEIVIQSTCFASLNLTIPIPDLENETVRIDLIDVRPGYNVNTFVYSFNKKSNNDLYRSYVDIIRNDCLQREFTDQTRTSNVQRMCSIARINLSFDDFVPIFKKVPGQVLEKTVNLVTDSIQLVTAPYIGLPVVGTKYIISVIKASIEAQTNAFKLLDITIRVIQGSEAPASIIYGYFKLFQPLVKGALPIIVLSEGSNPIAPVVDAFGEILEKLIYPPVIENNPQKDELINEFVGAASEYVGGQLNEAQKSNFCSPSNVNEFLSSCIKGQSGSTCLALYDNICNN